MYVVWIAESEDSNNNNNKFEVIFFGKETNLFSFLKLFYFF